MEGSLPVPFDVKINMIELGAKYSGFIPYGVKNRSSNIYLCVGQILTILPTKGLFTLCETGSESEKDKRNKQKRAKTCPKGTVKRHFNEGTMEFSLNGSEIQ